MFRPLRAILEDHPDHHEEIQMLTPLDILTFYIRDRFLRRILLILQFLYLHSTDNMY
jgi:hypothetical protein